MKYTVIYDISESKKKERTQTAYCLSQDSVWRLIYSIEKLGYTLKSVTCDEEK